MKMFIDNVIIDGEDKGEVYIESDERQFTVNVYNGKYNKDGSPSYVVKANYQHLTAALRYTRRMEIHHSTVSTITEMIRLLEQQNSKIDELAKVTV